MARKNLAIPTKVSAAQSLAISFIGPSMNVDYMDNVFILLDCTSVTDNIGTFGVQARFVPAEGKGSPSNWVDLTLDSVPTLANADEAIGINLNQVPFSEFRVVFTANGTTPNGVCAVWYSARQVGG